jgi:hypothetical protein
MRARAFLALLFAVLALPAGRAGAQPVCTPLTEEQAMAVSDVVFDGIAQPGPAAPNGVLATPAVFSVIKFVKGSGPAAIRVAGGPRTEGIGLLSLPSAGVNVHAGEEWVIYAKGASDGIVETSSCYGSHLASAAAPFIRPSGSASPSPSPSEVVGPPLTVSPDYRSWKLWSLGSMVGLGLVMGVGYWVARTVIGTS